MRRAYAPFLTLFVLYILLLIASTGPVTADSEHCPDKDNTVKVENAEDAGSLVFDAGTEFCAKKKTGNTGVITADGSTTLYEYLVAADIDGEEGEGPSYYIVYTTPVESEEPSSPASASTTPSSSPSPSMSTTSPSPSDSASPTPSGTSTPTPSASAPSTPVPTATPVPVVPKIPDTTMGIEDKRDIDGVSFGVAIILLSALMVWALRRDAA